MMWELDDGGESEFCPCGVTLMGDADENDGLCGDCADQPHPGRDVDGYPSCRCGECETYWDALMEKSKAQLLGDRRIADLEGLADAELVWAILSRGLATLDGFREGLTKALNDAGVPAMPSWQAAIDYLVRERDEALAEVQRLYEQYEAESLSKPRLKRRAIEAIATGILALRPLDKMSVEVQEDGTYAVTFTGGATALPTIQRGQS